MTGPGILPALADATVDIDTVAPWPGNPRRGNIEVIAESLSRTGQYRPLIVQASTGLICAGNQTWHAAKSLGWTEIAAVLHAVDDDTARRIVAVDNRAADLASYDEALLAELLGGLDGLAGTGFTPDDLDDLLASLSVEATPVLIAELPATDAAYSETEEEMAARAQRISGQEPRYAQGLAEVILIYPEPARVAVLADIVRLREHLGEATTSGEAVAAAVRAGLALLEGDCADALTALTVPRE